MTKILIIDDEDLICQGITSMIQRLDSIAVDEIYTAGNGKEGLSQYHLHQPDIVITDIRMPVMDGLEMMKQIRQIDQEVSIVVLSGYAEFDYVKQAFLLGAVDYLLKPVTIEELERVINRIFLEQKQTAASDEDQLREKERYRRAVLDNFLHKVFSWQQLTVSSILDQVEGIELLFPYTNFCLLQLRATGKLSSLTLDSLTRTFTVCLDTRFKEYPVRTHRFLPKNDEVIFLVNFSPKIEFDNFIKCFQQVTVKARESADQRFFAAVSNCQAGIESLGRLYKQVDTAMAYKILYPEQTLITYASLDARKDQPLLDPNQILSLKAALRAAHITQFNTLIDEIFMDSRFAGLTIASVHDLYLSVLLAISEVFHERNGIVCNSLEKDFFSFATLSELRIFIKNEAGALFSGRYKENQVGLIHLMMNYIKDHYSEDIDMSTVAEAFSMSYSYFSKYFKEEAGMNFSDYLNQVRMEAAKNLLDDPSCKIYQAAHQVGIDNSKYFARLFHQYFGISPKAYQQKTNRR